MSDELYPYKPQRKEPNIVTGYHDDITNITMALKNHAGRIEQMQMVTALSLFSNFMMLIAVMMLSQ